MRNPKLPACCLLLAAAVTAFGQNGMLRGPVSGMVFDAEARAIRPVIGAPGAAYLGQPAVAGLDWASVAPSGELAIAVAEGQLRLLHWPADGSAVTTILSEEAQTPARVAWSADSSAVAVQEVTGRLRVWRAQGAAPVGDIDLSLLPGSLCALAVENSGAVVAGMEDAAAGGVYRLEASQAPSLVAATNAPGVVALTRGGRDLFVADRATRRVIEVRDYRDSAAAIPLADETSGIAEPAAMAVSEDGKRLFVADRARNTIGVFDLEARSLAGEIGLEFSPTSMEPLSGHSLYLLRSGGGGEPFQVLSAGRDPAVYFVPAERPTPEVQQ